MPRLHYALRSLSKAPLLSLVVVLSLGLGIGANTAIFSLLNQILLSSLAVDRPEELALVTTPGAPKSGSMSTSESGGGDYVFSYPGFRELERQPRDLAEVAAFQESGANLAYGNQTVAGQVMLVSGGYFHVLRVNAVAGRTIAPEDDRGAGNPVAVLGYSYWQNKLGGQIGALNQPMRIAGQMFTIVGVAPKGFHGTTLGAQPDVFVPLATKTLLSPDWKGANRHNDYRFYLVARLKPGVSREQAAGPMNAVYRALVEEQAKVSQFDRADLERLRGSKLTLIEGRQGHSFIRDAGKTPLFILLASTGMVLLIAMANAANLLLARSAERRKELAIRAALGAGRGEIAWQMLSEALLLAAAGGVAGVALSSLTLKLMIAQVVSSGAPADFLTTELQWPVLLYALGLSLATGLVFGLYPAWEAARAGVAGVLNQESGHASSARGAARVRKALVCAQVTISAVLLIPTGLFLKSLVHIMRVDLGVRTENLVTFRLAPELNGYKPEQSRALFERAEREMAAIPGVSGVAAAMVPLIGGGMWMNTVTVEGFQPGARKEADSCLNEIGPGFLGKMGIPLVMGREFTERDNLAGPKVAVVNEQFAKYFFGGQSPLGRKFTPGVGPKAIPDTEIVGVVKDSHYAAVKEKPQRVYYTPWRQDKGIGEMSFYVRSTLAPEQVMAQVRRVARSLDPSLPADELRTMEDQVRRDIFIDRLVLNLSATFATLATALAMLGLYGVMAHSVVRRTREIGIRMALGAAPGGIQGMVLREMLWILAIGLATGIPAALTLAHVAKSQLFGVGSNDPVVVVAASLALAMAAFAAGYLPARRAARVNPIEALRYE
jgi:predicted permease